MPIHRISHKWPLPSDYPTNPNPDPALKGVKGGNCNREACQKPGAVWFNHSTHAYYCPSCAELLNDVNRDWAVPQYGHDLCTKEEDDVDSD